MSLSKALGIVFFEFVMVKLGCYLLNIQGEHTIIDLLAYSGYKFIGVIITLLIGLTRLGRLAYWSVWAYTTAANAFFLVSARALCWLDQKSVKEAYVTNRVCSRPPTLCSSALCATSYFQTPRLRRASPSHKPSGAGASSSCSPLPSPRASSGGSSSSGSGIESTLRGEQHAVLVFVCCNYSHPRKRRLMCTRITSLSMIKGALPGLWARFAAFAARHTNIHFCREAQMRGVRLLGCGSRRVPALILRQATTESRLWSPGQ